MKWHSMFVMCLKKGCIFMKIKKVLGALAVLLALTVVGCSSATNNPSGNSGSQTSSALPSIKITVEGNKRTLEVGETVQLSADVEDVTWESSVATVATVDNQGLVTAVAAGSTKISAKKDGYKAGEVSITVNTPANPLLTPLVRNYTEGDPAQNSAGKDYIPLNDATANKVGVKISIQNWEIAEGAPDTTKLASDGGIEPKNNHEVFIAYKIKAPKAGNYQMVMNGKCSSGDGESKTLDQRAFMVKLNGTEVNVEADRNPMTTSLADFVAVPTLTLSGPEQEDIIAVSCSDYRIKFGTSSFVLFNEI